MSTTQEALRSLDGLALPTSGTWEIDRTHSQVGFVARHMMVSKVRGRFSDFAGTIHIADDPTESSVEATINTESIDTGDPNRDAHVRSADFLDVERYPTITFKAEGPVQTSGPRFTITGYLTVKGVTRPITLEGEYTGFMSDARMGTRLGLSAWGEINREDFGVNFNAVLETGGVVVGKTIRLEIEAEAVLKS